MAYTLRKTRNVEADIAKWIMLMMIMLPLVFLGVFSGVSHKGTMQYTDRSIVQIEGQLRSR